jgi:hypothetical protein
MTLKGFNKEIWFNSRKNWIQFYKMIRLMKMKQLKRSEVERRQSLLIEGLAMCEFDKEINNLWTQAFKGFTPKLTKNLLISFLSTFQTTWTQSNSALRTYHQITWIKLWRIPSKISSIPTCNQKEMCLSCYLGSLGNKRRSLQVLFNFRARISIATLKESYKRLLSHNIFTRTKK